MSKAEEFMRTQRHAHARQREQGSALLIVFLFAAMIAIMLYMELPVAAFEAQRAREQVLIDHGNEYAHAVKLYVRKFGTFPPSMDALENTNRMRFLRHRFKDPLTGKDDWRILHAGPAGQLTDSKVNPITNTPNGASSGSGGTPNSSTTSASSNGQNGAFGSSGFSSQANSSSGDQTVVAAVPQRPPAVSASGNPTQQTNGALDLNQSPTMPLLPTGDTTAQNSQPATAGTGNPSANGNPATANPGGAPGTGPMDTVRNMLNNPNNPGVQMAASGPPVSPSSATTSSSPQAAFGQINSGGIAGVASKAEGHTIKTVNDQTDYSLWEFYYDPTKDATRGIANAAANGANGANNGAPGSSNSSPQSVPGQNSTTIPLSTNQVANPFPSASNPPQ